MYNKEMKTNYSLPSVPPLSPYHLPPYSLEDPDDKYKTKYENWEVIELDDVKSLEKEHIAYIKNIVDRVLQTEYMKFIGEKSGFKQDDIFSEVKLNINYHQINIKIKKVEPFTSKKFIKNTSLAILKILLGNPLKILGALTITYTWLK